MTSRMTSRTRLWTRGLQLDVMQAYFRQLAAGVAYIHRTGVLHCSIHAGNILINDRGTVQVNG